MRRKVILIASLVFLAAVAAVLTTPRGRWLACRAWRRVRGEATVEQRLGQYGPAARERMAPHFPSAGVEYPPRAVAMVGIKDVNVLEVWARGDDEQFRFVRSYSILGASGQLGPKLREGDHQVPEGIYSVESLHPNSMFHLALRLNYPNEFDRERGRADGRERLGGDIMIHGSTGSVGCLAMGDEVIEELFVLAADVGIRNTSIIITPVDFRDGTLPADMHAVPAWTEQLYDKIAKRLQELRR